MKIIGITGGVGAGKSEVLKLIDKMCRCVIVTADELAKSLEEPGEVCYEPLIALLGDEILSEDGHIDKKKMAAKIFENGTDKRDAVNKIVHPAVKSRILELISKEREKAYNDYFFIEAALLIEDHYDKIVDELWYIYADEDVRRKRLKDSRGYSDERIDDIMDSQCSDEVFRAHCAVVIDNSRSIEDTREQISMIINTVR